VSGKKMAVLSQIFVINVQGILHLSVIDKF